MGIPTTFERPRQSCAWRAFPRHSSSAPAVWEIRGDSGGTASRVPLRPRIGFRLNLRVCRRLVRRMASALAKAEGRRRWISRCVCNRCTRSSVTVWCKISRIPCYPEAAERRNFVQSWMRLECASSTRIRLRRWAHIPKITLCCPCSRGTNNSPRSLETSPDSRISQARDHDSSRIRTGASSPTTRTPARRSRTLAWRRLSSITQVDSIPWVSRISFPDTTCHLSPPTGFARGCVESWVHRNSTHRAAATQRISCRSRTSAPCRRGAPREPDLWIRARAAHPSVLRAALLRKALRPDPREVFGISRCRICPRIRKRETFHDRRPRSEQREPQRYHRRGPDQGERGPLRQFRLYRVRACAPPRV